MSVKINAKSRKIQKRRLLDLEGLNNNAECFVIYWSENKIIRLPVKYRHKDICDEHVKTRLFFLKWDFELLYYSTRGCLLLSFDILFMFLGHTNPKLCVSVNVVVVNLCKSTLSRKKQLNVGILHNLREF